MSKLMIPLFVAAALVAGPVNAETADVAVPATAPAKTEWTLKEIQADTEKAFVEQDLNKDGVVDAVDRDIQRQQKLDARFAEFDADKDGNISKAEWAQGNSSKVAANDQSITLAALMDQVRDDFTKLDLNGDGTLTAAERTEAFAAMRKQRDEARASQGSETSTAATEK